jgi:hypothetical protein
MGGLLERAWVEASDLVSADAAGFVPSPRGGRLTRDLRVTVTLRSPYPVEVRPGPRRRYQAGTLVWEVVRWGDGVLASIPVSSERNQWVVFDPLAALAADLLVEARPIEEIRFRL